MKVWSEAKSLHHVFWKTQRKGLLIASQIQLPPFPTATALLPGFFVPFRVMAAASHVLQACSLAPAACLACSIQRSFCHISAPLPYLRPSCDSPGPGCDL